MVCGLAQICCPVFWISSFCLADPAFGNNGKEVFKSTQTIFRKKKFSPSIDPGESHGVVRFPFQPQKIATNFACDGSGYGNSIPFLTIQMCSLLS
jgi:hypothetical protein